jgi:hypothetical protein
MDDLWRQAGGGTPRYSQARFAALLHAAPGLSAPESCGGCTGRAPHNCWFAAVGVAVAASRRRKRAPKAAPGQIALFPPADICHGQRNTALATVNQSIPVSVRLSVPTCGHSAKNAPQAGTPAIRERTR